jgi:hypothetical protein
MGFSKKQIFPSNTSKGGEKNVVEAEKKESRRLHRL